MSQKHLGPYEILGVLGRGGMGTVFRGRHESTGEMVAIKALSHSSSDDTHFRQRFESEIQALLKLNHPNIVRILSHGQEKGTLYFAMELVEGTSLFHLQRKVKKFDWREVLAIARDVASALRHAHDRGVIHRDLKPGNLMKSDHERIIKVADFGIAKSFGANNDTRDNVIGTLDYMSPEQAAGKPVTVRSDLYGLGAVLFTLLSGSPPFASNSIEESLRNLTRVPAPPIRERVSNVPEELEMLIAELLEKKPENRTPTAFALLKKLDYVEQVLRGNSEAKTAHGNETGAQVSKDVFLLGEPENRLEPTTPGKNTSKNTARNRMESPKTRATKETIEIKNDDVGEDPMLKLEEPAPVREDYFKPITDKHRQSYTIGDAEPTKPKGLGWFPMALLLTIMVGLGAYGTYQALKPPTADQLFARIEADADSPLKVNDEIKQFLELYPQDDRAPQVEELQKVQAALAFVKRLSVRVNLPGENRLSVLEQSFVNVMNKLQENPAAGFSQLEAFVKLYDAGEETPADNQEVVQAAVLMLKKARNDVNKQMDWNLKNIRDAMKRAENQPEQAPEIYQSIIQLYQDVEYAQEFVDLARERLK